LRGLNFEKNKLPKSQIFFLKDIKIERVINFVNANLNLSNNRAINLTLLKTFEN
jgi:hypothetical protein